MVPGDEYGFGGFSLALSDNPAEGGATEHRHSCGEVFVVYAGRGVYTIGGVEVVAEPGDMVIVPRRTWHSFRADGDMRLRHVAVYDSGDPDIELPSSSGGVSSDRMMGRTSTALRSATESAARDQP